jgi:hypothetical protein
MVVFELLAGLTGFAQVAGRSAERFVEVVVGRVLHVDVVASHLLDKLEADLEVGELVIDDLERVRDGVERVLLSVEECHGVLGKGLSVAGFQYAD